MESTEDDLELIRRHLLGADYQELLALKASVNNPIEFSALLSRVISEAITLRVNQDDSLSRALSATIEGAITRSIHDNPKALADSLYPVMGPSIRKSITEALSQMLENINNLLEQGLSPRALKWRIDAWRTGKSYSEIVLSNTLDYQVEQVFLIHAETSLLIHHLQSELAITKDPDMVSSMLSAIQDFIVDSFSVEDGDALHSLQLGDLTVVVERGPQAILAGVVRGRVPASLRLLFVETVETIHGNFDQALESFSGDTEPFVLLGPALEPCLQMAQREQEEQGLPWLGILSVLGVIAVAAFFAYQDYRFVEARREAVLELGAEPGIVVSGEEMRDDRLVISGLRDPFARVPEDVIGGQETHRLGLAFEFEPYLSLEGTMVSARLERVLAPPSGVEIGYASQRLSVSGRAHIDWFDQLQARWRGIPGLEVLDTSGLDVYDPVLERMQSLATEIGQARLAYDRGEIGTISTPAEIERVASRMMELSALAAKSGRSVVIHVLGHTDTTGTPAMNLLLAGARADRTREQLIEHGVSEDLLTAHAGQDYERETGLRQRTERQTSFVVVGDLEMDLP